MSGFSTPEVARRKRRPQREPSEKSLSPGSSVGSAVDCVSGDGRRRPEGSRTAGNKLFQRGAEQRSRLGQPQTSEERHRKRCRTKDGKLEAGREREAGLVIIDGNQCRNLTLDEGREDHEEEDRRFAAVPAIPDVPGEATHRPVIPVPPSSTDSTEGANGGRCWDRTSDLRRVKTAL